MTNNETQNLIVTENAAARIAFLQKKHGKEDLALRLTVLGGGCSGFQYQYDFDAESKADDMRIEKDGVYVVTDPISMNYLAGARLDYVEDLMAAAFKIDNPNAETACGCGNSFSIDMDNI